MLLRFGDVYLNPAQVTAMVWERQFYMNTSVFTLVVTMSSGAQHRFNEHDRPHEVEKWIMAAQREAH